MKVMVVVVEVVMVSVLCCKTISMSISISCEENVMVLENGQGGN